MPQRRLKPAHIPAQRNGSHAHIWGRDFALATAINFVAMTIYYLLFVTSAEYTAQTYGASLGVAGLSAGMLVLGCLAGRFLSGSVVSFLGLRLMLLCGILLYALSLLAFYLCSSLPMIFIQRVAIGLGVGIAGSATATIVSYVVPREDKGLGIGIFTISTVLALGLGPFLGIMLAGHIEYGGMIHWLAAIILACALLTPLFAPVAGESRKHRPMLRLSSYIDPRVARFSMVTLVVFMSYGCAQAFITSFAQSRGLTEAASFFFAMYAAAALVSRPMTGHWLDTHGENIVLMPVFLFSIAGVLLMAVANSPLMLLLAGACYGLGFGNFQSVGQAVSLSLVTPSRYPQATSTFFIFTDLGICIGPYIFGSLVPVIGYFGMFTTQFCSLLLALALYYAVHGRKLNFSASRGSAQN